MQVPSSSHRVCTQTCTHQPYTPFSKSERSLALPWERSVHHRAARLCLSLSLSHTHTLSISLSLSHTHTLTLSLSHTHTHTVSLFHTHTLCLSLSHTHTHRPRCSGSAATEPDLCQKVIATSKVNLATTLDCVLTVLPFVHLRWCSGLRV